jgi:hypothetical protein
MLKDCLLDKCTLLGRISSTIVSTMRSRAARWTFGSGV